VIGYVLMTQMGILKLPTVSQPMQTVFIDDQPAQPEPKEPDIKPEVDIPAPQVEQPMPQVEVADLPPMENVEAPPSESAISASSNASAPQELKATQRVEPVYPPTSRRMGEEGVVRLKVLVDERGRPHEVVVQNSSGYPRLDQAAIEAVRRWRFEPATDGSRAVSAWSAVAIRFQLKNA
jgi:protein TonB